MKRLWLIKGKMRGTEIRKRLELLEKTIEYPMNFEEDYKRLQLPAEQMNEAKVAYFQFIEEMRQAMGKSVFDFNATPKRPAFSFVREEKSMAESIQNPKSLPLQINGAKMGNIFLLKDGTLSLLPQESANPQVGQIAKEEFLEASKVLIKNGSVQIALPQGKGEMSFASRPINGNRFLRLETKVKQGRNEHIRVALFPLEEDQKLGGKLEELAGSKLLEREILLAKSEFMNAHL